MTSEEDAHPKRMSRPAAKSSPSYRPSESTSTAGTRTRQGTPAQTRLGSTLPPTTSDESASKSELAPEFFLDSPFLTPSELGAEEDVDMDMSDDAQPESGTDPQGLDVENDTAARSQHAAADVDFSSQSTDAPHALGLPLRLSPNAAESRHELVGQAREEQQDRTQFEQDMDLLRDCLNSEQAKEPNHRIFSTWSNSAWSADVKCIIEKIRATRWRLDQIEKDEEKLEQRRLGITQQRHGITQRREEHAQQEAELKHSEQELTQREQELTQHEHGVKRSREEFERCTSNAAIRANMPSICSLTRTSTPDS